MYAENPWKSRYMFFRGVHREKERANGRGVRENGLIELVNSSE